MEIKRRLTKVAKRFTLYAEEMNTVVELRRLCSRLEELAGYCEEKEELAKANAEARKQGFSSAVEAGAAAVKQKNKEIAELHDQESKEAREDQQQQGADLSLPKTESVDPVTRNEDGSPAADEGAAEVSPTTEETEGGNGAGGESSEAK